MAAPEDLVAFSAAFDRLARRWLWWILAAHIGVSGVEVAGQTIGIYPFAWILAPLVLLALLDLRATVAAVGAPAAHRTLTTVLVVATVTAALDLTGTLVATGTGNSGFLGVT